MFLTNSIKTFFHFGHSLCHSLQSTNTGDSCNNNSVENGNVIGGESSRAGLSTHHNIVPSAPNLPAQTEIALKNSADEEEGLGPFKESDLVESYKVADFCQVSMMLERYVLREGLSYDGICAGLCISWLNLQLQPTPAANVPQMRETIEMLKRGDLYFHAQNIQNMYKSSYREGLFPKYFSSHFSEVLLIYLTSPKLWRFLLISLIDFSILLIGFLCKILIPILIGYACIRLFFYIFFYILVRSYGRKNEEAIKETALCFGINAENSIPFKISNSNRQEIILQCAKNIKKNNLPAKNFSINKSSDIKPQRYSFLIIGSKDELLTTHKRWAHIIAVKWENKKFFLYDPNYGGYEIPEDHFAGFIDKLFSKNEEYYSFKKKLQPAGQVHIMHASWNEDKNNVTLPKENVFLLGNSIEKYKHFIKENEHFAEENESFMESAFKNMEDCLGIENKNTSESKIANPSESAALQGMREYLKILKEIGVNFQANLKEISSKLNPPQEHSDDFSEIIESHRDRIESELMTWRMACEYANEICEKISKNKNLDKSYSFPLSYLKRERISFNIFDNYMKQVFLKNT